MIVNKIPSKESNIKNTLTDEVNRDELLVKALARVNQVEKSMQINATIMKNVTQWEEYIKLAEIDLPKVNRTTFSREVNELEIRIELVKMKIQKLNKLLSSNYNYVRRKSTKGGKEMVSKKFMGLAVVTLLG